MVCIRRDAAARSGSLPSTSEEASVSSRRRPGRRCRHLPRQYDLRHSLASLLLMEQQWNPAEIAAQMGHTTASAHVGQGHHTRIRADYRTRSGRPPPLTRRPLPCRALVDPGGGGRCGRVRRARQLLPCAEAGVGRGVRGLAGRDPGRARRGPRRPRRIAGRSRSGRGPDRRRTRRPRAVHAHARAGRMAADAVAHHPAPMKPRRMQPFFKGLASARRGCRHAVGSTRVRSSRTARGGRGADTQAKSMPSRPSRRAGARAFGRAHAESAARQR
jgi:hypothetical protein